MQRLKAIDFFCGGGGMTCGLRQAGVDVLAGIDFDLEARETYEINNPGSTFIHADIKELDSTFLQTSCGIKKNDDYLLFVGCSPCQYYSIINTNKEKSRNSKDLLNHFARFIDFYRPGFVLVENVPGIVTNKESVLPSFLDDLQNLGYKNIKYGVLDLSYYGIPQSRKRFSLIATRLELPHLTLPDRDKKRSLVRDFLGEHNGFPKVDAGHRDDSFFCHTVAGLSQKSLQRIRKTSHNGGSRADWAEDSDLQLKCFVGRDNCFKDTFGRIWWDKPAPTITTKFFSLSNGRFGHPEEDRALSIREGATLQTFPKSYKFISRSIATSARLIGNAVPCEYARRVGLHIQRLMDSYDCKAKKITTIL